MSATSDRPPRRGRILVAEDDTQMRRVVADVLRKESYEVEELHDGQQLFVRVARAYVPQLEGGFDLLVSDLRMPFFSGLDILRHIRAAHVQTPVLLMTAFGDDELRGRVRGLGATLLDKPFTLQALRDAVREILARHPPK